MEESEFEKNMELARDLTGLSTDLNGLSTQSDQNAGNNSRAELMESKHRALSSKKERDSSVRYPDLLKRHLQVRMCNMPKMSRQWKKSRHSQI
jgi:hypothetical protein